MDGVFPSTLHNSDPSGWFVNCSPTAPAAVEVQEFCTLAEEILVHSSVRRVFWNMCCGCVLEHSLKSLRKQVYFQAATYAYNRNCSRLFENKAFAIDGLDRDSLFAWVIDWLAEFHMRESGACFNSNPFSFQNLFVEMSLNWLPKISQMVRIHNNTIALLSPLIIIISSFE